MDAGKRRLELDEVTKNIIRCAHTVSNTLGCGSSDLAVRLLRAGIKHKSARFAVPVLYLRHGENDRSRFAENRRRLDEVLHSERTRVILGVEQYL